MISYRIFVFIRKKDCGVNLRNKGKLLSAAAAAVVRGINMHTNRAAAGDRILLFFFCFFSARQNYRYNNRIEKHHIHSFSNIHISPGIIV